jgi:hypothetical protein
VPALGSGSGIRLSARSITPLLFRTLLPTTALN